ncbi:MAG TPA: hypothetical protein VIR79_02305 [Nitrospira sp.]
MRPSFKTGFSFGLTSGVITTLGLMVGLDAGTHSRAVVLGGICTIAVADALSDAMGIHLAEESKNRGSTHVWESTIATFVAKLGIALTFTVPVLLLPLRVAMLVSVFWGLLLLTVLSFLLARAQGIAPWKVVGEHLTIALCVVTLSHLVGDWVQGLNE